ncbi:MAG: hypothetical protein J0M08_09450 [Bacteroidetes bacterium]|nr:hypothetical protein [Bacteroidota bacterium]
MKKTTICFMSFLLYTFIHYAQTPSAINYQGILRNINGLPINNKTISVRLSILHNSVNGSIDFQETHVDTTNQFGLYTLHIGRGNVTTGNFISIDWGLSSHFLQVDIDTSGGTNYITMGTSELLAVPYALHAEKANTCTQLDTGSIAQTLRHNGTKWIADTLLYNNGTKIGIGTTNPLASVTIQNTAGSALALTNTKLNPNAGDLLGALMFGTQATSNSINSYDAGIKAFAEQNHSGSNHATYLSFHTKPSTLGPGSASIERARINANGSFDFGTSKFSWGPTIGNNDVSMYRTYPNVLKIDGALFVGNFGSPDADWTVRPARTFTATGRAGQLGVRGQITTANGHDTYMALIESDGINIPSGYSSSTIASLRVDEPNITLGTSVNLGSAASVLIAGAPTEGSVNYGLWTKGDVRFDNKVGIGIGATQPQGALDIQSTEGGLIVPRMTTTERNALLPINGTIIYNTTTNQFNFYENNNWGTK